MEILDLKRITTEPKNATQKFKIRLDPWRGLVEMSEPNAGHLKLAIQKRKSKQDESEESI